MIFSRQFITKNGKTVVIRNAVCEDASSITDVSNQVIRETPYLSRTEKDTPDTEENTRDYVDDCFSSEREAFLIAELDGKIVGFAHLDGNGSRVKYLHRCSIDLSILKQFCSIGIGKAMMQSLIELALKSDYEQIELNVIENNINAVRLYKSLGFDVYGRKPHAMKFTDGTYGDFLFMVKFLSK